VASAAAWALLAALWAGAAAHALSRLFAPLEVVLPAAIGAAVGASLAVTVRQLRLSRPWPVVAVAALAVTIAMVAQLVLDYRVTRAGHVAELDQELEVSAGIVAREELAQEREARLAHWTLWRYASARIGFDDGSFTDTPPVLGRTGTLAASTFELMLAIVIACLLARRAAAEPACPLCGEWRAERPLGSAAHGVGRAVIDRLLAGDASGAAALLRPPDTREEVRISLLRCPAGHDRDGGVLRLGELFWTRGRRLSLRRLADLEADGSDLAAIEAQLSRAPEP